MSSALGWRTARLQISRTIPGIREADQIRVCCAGLSRRKAWLIASVMDESMMEHFSYLKHKTGQPSNPNHLSDGRRSGVITSS